jgi:hypothetical protein
MPSIRPFRPSDETAVIALWQDCGLIRPQNDPRRDIQRKLKVRPEWFLVAAQDSEVIGSIMIG